MRTGIRNDAFSNKQYSQKGPVSPSVYVNILDPVESSSDVNVDVVSEDANSRVVVAVGQRRSTVLDLLSMTQSNSVKSQQSTNPKNAVIQGQNNKLQFSKTLSTHKQIQLQQQQKHHPKFFEQNQIESLQQKQQLKRESIRKQSNSMLQSSSAETNLSRSSIVSLSTMLASHQGSFHNRDNSNQSVLLKSFLSDRITEDNDFIIDDKKSAGLNDKHQNGLFGATATLKQSRQLFPLSEKPDYLLKGTSQNEKLHKQFHSTSMAINNKSKLIPINSHHNYSTMSEDRFGQTSMSAFAAQKEKNAKYKLNSACFLQTNYQRRKEPIYREIMADDLASLSIKSAERMKIEVDFSPQYLRGGNITRVKESMSNNAHLELEKLNNFLTNSESMLQISVELLEKIKSPTSTMPQLYDLLVQLSEKSLDSCNASLALTTKYIHATLACMCGDKDISIKLWKEYLRLCNGYCAFYFKIIAYKNLGRIYLERGNYMKSLVYLKKLLKYAWLYDLYDLENFTYEEISRAYYHLNEIDLTLYFYERAIRYQVEPSHSGIRSVGVTVAKYEQERKRKMALDSTLSDDDFELEGFKNAEFLNAKMQRMNTTNNASVATTSSNTADIHNNGGAAQNDKDSVGGRTVLKGKVKEKSIAEDEEEARFDLNEQTELNLKKSIRRHRLNKFKLDSSVTSLEGMKALAALKNKMSEPLGPIQISNKYRNNAFVNLDGRINYTTENTCVVPKFIVYQHKNQIRAYDKIYVNHLSCSRQVSQLMNLTNRLDDEHDSYISNDCVRLRKVTPTMRRLIAVYEDNILSFQAAAKSRIHMILEAIK